MKQAHKEPRIISSFIESEALPMWTPNSLIRHKCSGIIRLVIEAHGRYTTVVDPSSHQELVPQEVLLERQYSYWTRDLDQENTDPINYQGEWRVTPMIV